MVEIESPLFIDVVRKKTLRHPTARQFDKAAWIDAAKALKHISDRDGQLLLAAVHYGQEIALLRSTFEDQLFKNLDRRTGLLLSVAMANYNYEILSKKARQKTKETIKGRVLHLGYVGRQAIVSGPSGNEATPDTVVATIVDTLPHCLERADKLPIQASASVFNYWDRGSKLFAIMSAEHSLRSLWQRVLWDGWKLEPEGKTFRQSPGDRQLATLWEVWLWRHEMVLSQGANLEAIAESISVHHGKPAEPFISPTVTGIGGSSRETRSFRFGDVSGREGGQTWHRSESVILEDSYLAQFLDAPLPKLANSLCCRDLQKAWCIIRDCGRILATKAKARKFENLDAIETLAFLIRRSELERALTNCAGFDQEQAKQTIDFFICDLANLTNLFTKGFWAAPLLGIDDNNVVMVFASISVGSAIRRVEGWLEKGGLSDHLSDAARGLKYEAWVRSELIDALKKNSLLPNAKCAHNSISRPDEKGEQIDLLVALGGILIVGEVKCFLYPVEASEHYDYLRKLDEAGNQAKRKSQWLADRPTVIADSLGISLERAKEIRPIPVVITNQGAGFSLAMNGVRIIDFHFLSVYFSTNEYLAGMAFHMAGNEAVEHLEKLYGSENEAADAFELTMARPPPLQRYLNAAVWKDDQFPMSNGDNMVLEICELGSAFTDDAERAASIFKPLGRTK